MDEPISDYDSSKESLEIYRIILITLFGIIIFLCAHRFYLSFSEANSQHIKLLRFILIYTAIDVTCKIQSGLVFVFVNRYIHLPNIAYRILAFMPCSIFSVLLSRVCYFLIDIYYSIDNKILIKVNQCVLSCTKLSLILYALFNVFFRLFIACSGNQPWMYKSSADKTLVMLSLIFSVISISMLTFISFLVYFKLKNAMKDEIGKEINRNLTGFICIYIFVISCFWISIIIGKVTINANDELKALIYFLYYLIGTVIPFLILIKFLYKNRHIRKNSVDYISLLILKDDELSNFMKSHESFSPLDE